jgi:hypothetical protein
VGDETRMGGGDEGTAEMTTRDDGETRMNCDLQVQTGSRVASVGRQISTKLESDVSLFNRKPTW